MNLKKIINILIVIIILLFSFIIGYILGETFIGSTNINIKGNYSKNGINNVKRVFMIYMVGSNLESEIGLASSDIDGLNSNKFNFEDNKIVLISGGTTTWYNNYMDTSETSIFEYTKNGIKKVKKQPKQNLGKEETLKNYLNYVYKNYDADEYSLIFWNHGAGIFGNEFDDLYNGDGITLQEMNNALKNSPFNKNKLELVIFRTCLAGNLETANIIKKYSKYMLASEEITNGVASTSVFEFLNDVDSEDYTYDIAKGFVENYKKIFKSYCSKYGYENDSCVNITYSLLDLNNIDSLNKQLNTFFKKTKNKIKTKYNDLAKIRSNMDQYAQEEPAYDLIDLYDLIDRYDKYSDNSKELKNEINKTVLYNYTNNDYSNGISIYFPYNGDFIKNYNNISPSNNYYEFIEIFTNYKQNKTDIQPFSFNNITKDNTNEKGADFELELTQDQANNYAKGKYIVFIKNSDGTYKPLYVSTDIILDGTTLKANVRDRALRVTDSSNDSGWLQLVETSHNNNSFTYETYVTLENFEDPENWKMDTAHLYIQIDEKNPNGKIVKATLESTTKDNEDNKLPNTVNVDFKDYKFIAFASSSYNLELDENGNYIDLGKSNGIIEGKEYKIDDFKFIRETFNKEYEYYAVFIIYDTKNNKTTSKLIKIN